MHPPRRRDPKPGCDLPLKKNQMPLEAIHCFLRLLLLPATAEDPVKLHKTLILGAARFRECEFGGKQRSLPVQHFEISCRPSRVAQVGKAHGFLQVLDGIFLADPHLMESVRLSNLRYTGGTTTNLE